jgi:RNA-binding protein
MANRIDPVFQLGKGGITEEYCLQIDHVLEARELIKIHILENSSYTAREAAEILAEAVEADVVAVIGSKAVLYRHSEMREKDGKETIVLP